MNDQEHSLKARKGADKPKVKIGIWSSHDGKAL